MATSTRSPSGRPRRGWKATSTASSMVLTGARSRREGGAGGLEVAVVAQGADVGPEVLGVAGPLNGRPHRDRPPALAPDRLLGGGGGDGDGLAQVEEPNLGGSAPDRAIA